MANSVGVPDFPTIPHPRRPVPFLRIIGLEYPERNSRRLRMDSGLCPPPQIGGA